MPEDSMSEPIFEDEPDFYDIDILTYQFEAVTKKVHKAYARLLHDNNKDEIIRDAANYIRCFREDLKYLKEIESAQGSSLIRERECILMQHQNNLTVLYIKMGIQSELEKLLPEL